MAHQTHAAPTGAGRIRNPLSLAGQVAIVTGGSHGIGLATARQLLAAGAQVAIFARADAQLDEARAMLRASGGAAEPVAVGGDVACEADVQSFFRTVEARLGQVDIVVSNAGFHHAAPLEAMRHQDWQAVFATHADGAFLFARTAFRHWNAHARGGRLLFVASKSGVAATVNAAAYAAAKAAQLQLARCLAEEGGARGIRVNCVLPDGVIRGTGIFSPAQRIANARRHGVAPEQLEQFYAARNALKRAIGPDDVARAIVFLCSEEANVISGAALTVDGGVISSYMR